MPVNMTDIVHVVHVPIEAFEAVQQSQVYTFYVYTIRLPKKDLRARGFLKQRVRVVVMYR